MIIYSQNFKLHDLEHFSVVLGSVATFVWFYGVEFKLEHTGGLETTLYDLLVGLGYGWKPHIRIKNQYGRVHTLCPIASVLACLPG